MKKKKYILILIIIVIISCATYLIKSPNISLSKLLGTANTETNNYDLFFPNIAKRTTPSNLLVMVFLYDDYSNHDQKTDYIFNMTDQEIETKYHNEIFGTGTVEEQTWSVNDFYKENSKGKFYFNPILLDNNSTGIYPIRFNKSFDMSAFSSDIKQGFQSLIEKEIDTSGFKWSSNKGGQQNQVLCIFPKIAVEHVGTYELNDGLSSDVAVIKYSSVLSTITHELGHALGMPDLYSQGGQASLMSETTLSSTVPDLRYPYASNNYTIPAHVDPLHKITYGWQNYEIVDKNTTVTLYPTTSSSYNTVIIPTGNNDQYYIIENRKASSFETQITKYTIRADIDDPEDAGYNDYEGVNIWRVDKLSYSTLQAGQDDKRKGDYIIGVLKYPLDSISPKKYSNTSDKNDYSKEETNIDITHVKNNSDGSVTVNINFSQANDNSYVVRYNSYDGYMDKTYKYSQNIAFPDDLFSRDGYKFIGWNTKQDGTGTTYNIDDIISELSDEEGKIVNLYAQWKREQDAVVRFNLNGAQGNMSNVTVDSETYILPECTVQELNPDLEFKGWLYNGMLWGPGSSVNVDNDIELVAQWEERVKHTITFETNGGTNIESQLVYNNSNIVVPDAPEKEGYKFGGWYEDSSLNTMFWYQKKITGDMTLYAKWIANEYIINKIDFEISEPIIGNEVTIEKDHDYWLWSSQKPEIIIKIPANSNYKLNDFEDSAHWISDLETPWEPFVGTIEENKQYYAQISFVSNDNYYFSDNLKIMVNGRDVDKVYYSDDKFLDVGVALTSKKDELKSYKILEGLDQQYNIKSNKELVFKTNGDISKLGELRIDGVIIDDKNYVISSKNGTITLKSNYLDTLSKGDHEITFIYSDGVAVTNFRVNGPLVNTENSIIENAEIDKRTNNSKNPQTEDKIYNYVSLIIISIVGLSGIFIYVFNKKSKDKFEG